MLNDSAKAFKSEEFIRNESSKFVQNAPSS